MVKKVLNSIVWRTKTVEIELVDGEYLEITPDRDAHGVFLRFTSRCAVYGESVAEVWEDFKCGLRTTLQAVEAAEKKNIIKRIEEGLAR